MSESGSVEETRENLVTEATSAEAEHTPPLVAPALLRSTPHAPGWIRRRARNVYRRPLLVSAVGLIVFVVVLLAAVIAPLQERSAMRASLPLVRPRPDTIEILKHIAMAGSVAHRSDSTLTAARLLNARPESVTDTARGTSTSSTSVLDTAALARTHDSAVAAFTSARRWLAQARDVDRDMDSADARAKSVDAIGASVPAMLAGAAALGGVIGFAFALALELREPRVADGDEAESIAGVPVLASIGEAPAAPARRRRADLETPPLVDLTSDAYRLLYAQLADQSDNLPLLSIVGEDAVTTAVVAANLGAVAARQVRDVLLIDTDVERQSLSSVTRLPGTPGLVDVLAGRLDWAAVVRSVTVGRDRTLDVLPSGAFGAHEALDSMIADVSELLEHVGRRYDCVLLSAPMSRAGELGLAATVATPVVVVRVARTPVSSLGRLTGLIRDRGAHSRGILMWNRGEPIPAAARPDDRNS